MTIISWILKNKYLPSPRIRQLNEKSGLLWLGVDWPKIPTILYNLPMDSEMDVGRDVRDVRGVWPGGDMELPDFDTLKHWALAEPERLDALLHQQIEALIAIQVGPDQAAAIAGPAVSHRLPAPSGQEQSRQLHPDCQHDARLPVWHAPPHRSPAGGVSDASRREGAARQCDPVGGSFQGINNFIGGHPILLFFDISFSANHPMLIIWVVCFLFAANSCRVLI